MKPVFVMAREGRPSTSSFDARGTVCSMISPLLANVYLHYDFDLRAQRWRRREAKGNVFVGFAAQNCEKRGLRKPETFKFLGFVLICTRSRRGLPDQEEVTVRPHAHEASEDQAGAARTEACASSRSRQMARASRRRILRLPRRANQQPGTVCVPLSRRHPLASATLPAQSKSAHGLGTDGKAGRRISPEAPCPASLAECGLPSDTRGRTRVREFRLHGSVRGALSNGRSLYVAACSARTSPWTGGPKAYRVALRALTTIELKNPKTSSGCVSKIWFCSSGSVIQGYLFRVQKCAVGHSQEVSSKVPARTL